jgi:hypothetical protein
VIGFRKLCAILRGLFSRENEKLRADAWAKEYVANLIAMPGHTKWPPDYIAIEGGLTPIQRAAFLKAWREMYARSSPTVVISEAEKP